MNRRQFIKALGAAAIAPGLDRAASSLADEARQVAITMDDFNWRESTRLAAPERNRAMLAALRAHSNLKIAMFVRGSYVDGPQGRRLLKEWDAAGHMIANHSYSHPYYHSPKVTSAAFAEDILKGESVLKDFPRFTKLFRFPYLKEGETREKRDSVRSFLKRHGYRTGHVTIDASDWFVDTRLRARITRDPSADLSPYRDFYLSHIWERSLFYDDLARKVLGRTVRHTLLVHYNLLNALFLGDLLRMFEAKGWKLVGAEEAFKDPVYSSAPEIVPAGESLIWALAKQTGRFEELLRYPGEDGEYEKEKMDKLGL